MNNKGLKNFLITELNLNPGLTGFGTIINAVELRNSIGAVSIEKILKQLETETQSADNLYRNIRWVIESGIKKTPNTRRNKWVKLFGDGKPSVKKFLYTLALYEREGWLS